MTTQTRFVHLSIFVLSLGISSVSAKEAHAQSRVDISGAASLTKIAGFDLIGGSFDVSGRYKIQDKLYAGWRTGTHLMGSDRFWSFDLGNLRVGEGLAVVPLTGQVEYVPFESSFEPVIGASAGLYGAGFINQKTAWRLGISPYVGVDWSGGRFFARYERLFGEVLGETVDYFSFGIQFRVSGPRR